MMKWWPWANEYCKNGSVPKVAFTSALAFSVSTSHLKSIKGDFFLLFFKIICSDTQGFLSLSFSVCPPSKDNVTTHSPCISIITQLSHRNWACSSFIIMLIVYTLKKNWDPRPLRAEGVLLSSWKGQAMTYVLFLSCAGVNVTSWAANIFVLSDHKK